MSTPDTADATTDTTTRPPGRFRAVMRSPVGAASVGLLACFAVLAVIAPLLWGDWAKEVNTDALREDSSAEHWLGTDNLGRDIFARVLVATRESLKLALIAALSGAAAGVSLGALTAVLGRRAQRLISSVVNVLIAFPALLLAMFTAIVIGVGAKGAVVAIAVAFTPTFARLTQTLAASIAGADFVSAARVIGVGRFRLLTRHVLPNIAEPLVLNATIAIGSALLALSGLSFLGLGVQPPDYDWGRMLNEGLDRIYVSPLAAVAPGVMIVVAGVGFNLLGEAVAQVISTRPAGGRDSDAERPNLMEGAAAQDEGPAVLRVRGLSVTFPARGGTVRAVRDVSVDVAPGEIVGIVGESGSGKSLTALATAGLVPHPGEVRTERLEIQGRSLRDTSPAEQRRLLGTSMAMVFQDPMSSLNPALRIGRQLAEVTEVHAGQSRREAMRLAADRLRGVRIPSPERRLRQYPHEFSGGMRQRAMIAMGLMGDPALIVADEPTTALDVTVQRQILDLLRDLSEESGVGVVLISHDIAVVAELCQRVLVMYAGRVVEELPVGALTDAAHPYTRALLASIPDMSTPRDEPLATIPGRPPDPTDDSPGCPFAPRCSAVGDRCWTERPALADHGVGQRVACWNPAWEATG